MKILDDYSTSDEVSAYYDHYIPKVVNNMSVDLTMQSCRTTNIEELHAYISKIIELKDGVKLLDAGCGIGGPAIYFATNYNIQVDSWTNSKFMYEYFGEQLKKLNNPLLNDRVKVIHGDYHNVLNTYGEESFDRIIFLESFLHSYNPETFLKELYKILKPGGILYLKEIILDEYPIWAFKKRKRCHEAYLAARRHFKYNYVKLETIKQWIISAGFNIEQCNKPKLKVDESPGDYYLTEIGQIPELSRCKGYTWSSCYEFKCRKYV